MADSALVDSKSRSNFYIAARPGYYPAVFGVYRPMGADGFIDWKERRARVDNDSMNDWEKTFLAAQIVEWNLGIPISLESVGKIRGEVYAKLIDQCVLESAPDPRPSDKALPQSGAEIDREKKDA